MPEIVKPFDGDEYGKIASKLVEIAGDCDNGEVQAVAVLVIRFGKSFELAVWVDKADRSRLRATAMELAAALAES